MKIGVYGNLTLDELDRNGKHLIRPGGSALYSSLAAAYLGARVSIFSNIGRDYPENILSSISSHLIDIAGVKKFDGLNTRFRISYNADSRRLEMVHPGRKLKPRHNLRSLQAIHLGPVFNEIGLDTLAYAWRHSEFLTLDVQGLLRTTGQDGFVRLARKNVNPFLSKCNLVKATEEEARVIAPASTIVATARGLLRQGAQYAIITRGRLGSLLVKKYGGAFRIPSIPERRVVDLTGAGDVFIGSWLATFMFVGDALWAAAVGGAFASLSVRGTGVSKFRFDRGELFRRASWVYEKSRLVKG
ncbi:MAG TPA: PfkB family carbohydrate kinase [Candidatus Bathyarchaeia archaeon]|nr:PfkB family carbohydrate kinase [Candidatus Bathyarchaeia archaeon]